MGRKNFLRAVHRTNPDPQRRAPAGVCAQCGGELYPGEACWRLWGALLCERCAGRRALEELAPFRLKAGEAGR